MKAESLIRFGAAVCLAAAIASVGFAVASRLRYKADSAVPTLAAPTWRADEPPASTPIVGIWTDGGIRSHVVVMVYGAAYPYEPGVNAIQAIEYNRPTMWTLIP